MNYVCPFDPSPLFEENTSDSVKNRQWGSLQRKSFQTVLSQMSIVIMRRPLVDGLGYLEMSTLYEPGALSYNNTSSQSKRSVSFCTFWQMEHVVGSDIVSVISHVGLIIRTSSRGFHSVFCPLGNLERERRKYESYLVMYSCIYMSTSYRTKALRVRERNLSGLIPWTSFPRI